MEHAGPRTRIRIIVALTVAFGLLLGAFAFPATATSSEGGGDVETVRSQTIGTIDYKTELLTGHRNATDNPERRAIYDDGIAELQALRSRATESSDIEELRAMESAAHAIYHEAKERAAATEPTEEERVAKARRAALETIDYKLGLFRKAAAGTEHAAKQEIYQRAIGELEQLRIRAETSSDISELESLRARAHEIYEATKRLIAEVGTGETEKTEEPPEKSKAEKLADARKATLRLIEYKVSILTHASEAARNRELATVYADTAAQITALIDEARDAPTIAALRGIESEALSLYQAAKREAAGSEEKPALQATDTLLAYAESLRSVVERLIEFVESTADESDETAGVAMRSGKKLNAAIDAVAGSAETGKRLEAWWKDLNLAIHEFRLALAVHVTSVTDAPDCINGWHLPG